MSAITQALSAALVDVIWQGALVGLVLWIVLAALRNRSSNARYAVCCAALVALAVLPALTTIALLAAAAPDARALSAMSDSGAPASMPQTMLPIWLVSDTPQMHMAWLARVQMWALPVWSAGVLLLSARFARGYTQLVALRRRESSSDEFVLSVVRTLAERIGIDRPVRVVVSSLSDGPSVVGWLCPAIVLPPATVMGLTPQQLEAILAHELAHIRRHDYAINIFQVVTETVYFYHPIVWWTSRQIRIERELCCDDIAVATCGDAVSYAHALAQLARNNLAAPVLAMGATEGSLLYRIRRLLGVDAQKNEPSRLPAVVTVCVALVCVVPSLDWLQAFAEFQATEQPRFEVASVKPNKRNDRQISIGTRGDRYTALGVSLGVLIRSAYQVQEFQIIGGPSWLDSDRFDIVAKAEPDPLNTSRSSASGPTRQQLMLRGLLAERFNLALHRETREMPIYALVVARRDGKLGPQLRRSTTDCTNGGAVRGRAGNVSPATAGWLQPPACGTNVRPGVVLLGGRTMTQFATALSTLTNTGSSLSRLVVDRTGLEGTFDVSLKFTPEYIPSTGPGMPPIDVNGPSIFTAVQEQLGLSLEAQRGPVEVLVIDRVEQPTPD